MLKFVILESDQDYGGVDPTILVVTILDDIIVLLSYVPASSGGSNTIFLG
jgi:hypothetical protein